MLTSKTRRGSGRRGVESVADEMLISDRQTERRLKNAPAKTKPARSLNNALCA
jgi:hypothetical protein